MTELKGVQNTKEVLALVLAGVQVVKSAQADGKIDANDLGQLLTLIPTVGPAIDGIAEVPKEIGDLSGEELAELVAYISAHQALADDAKIKAVISGGLKVVAGALEVINALKKTA